MRSVTGDAECYRGRASFRKPSSASLLEWSPKKLFGGLTMAYDFADLVQPWDYSVTAFPAQNGF